MSRNEIIERCSTAALEMRRDVLRLTHSTGSHGAHIAPALSIVDILAVLYLAVLRNDRDAFILSKGHGAMGYYTALCQAGYITREQLYTFEKNGTYLPSHPAKNKEYGIEFSGGSLGMGMAYAAGLAKSAKMKGLDRHVYVLIGDGEQNEGIIWESVFFAAQQKLDSLTVIIDYNKMQSDGPTSGIISIDPAALWTAANWNVATCDGHDAGSLYDAFSVVTEGQPKVIIASTVKGKGISFIENNNAWHRNRLTDSQLEDGLRELADMEAE